MPSSDHRPPENKRQAQGRTFEKLAARYFEENGYEILDRNWRAGHKEIDIIVKRNNLIVFVEVKSTFSTKFGHPAERVDKRKIKNLTEAASQYLLAKDIKNTDLRFDVVTFSQGQLEHFPDAFTTD